VSRPALINLWIPDGKAGTHATIYQMQRLAYQDRTEPAVLSLADQYPTPTSIDDFFRAVWRVVPDPDDCEYIRAPKHQAEFYFANGYLEGDCDDASTLSACLLSAVGWPAVITAIRRPGDADFSHVFTSAMENGVRVDIDPIVPAQMIPITDIAERMTINI
jgi:hypothetical protein